MKTKTKLIWGLIAVIVLLCFILIPMSVQYNMKATTAPERIPASAPPTMSAPPDDSRGGIDQILNQLEFGNIAFNAPKTMNLRDTAIIQLMLSLETPIDDLKQMIEAEGEREGAQIQVSDRMEAHLSGPDFTITAITPEIQAVPRSNITEWQWEVRPGSGGPHSLHLALSALLHVDGVPTPRMIRTYSKVIAVEVTLHQHVTSFFKKNWQWLWGAILIPIFAWLWKKKKASTSEVRR